LGDLGYIVRSAARSQTRPAVRRLERAAIGENHDLREAVMLNEGIVFNDTRTVMKSEMVRQLGRLGTTTPEELERAVFESLTGGRRTDIDWDVEDNKAGYFLWVKAFDGLITELAEDGYLRIEDRGDGAHSLVLAETDQGLDVSQFVYPPES
jgi:hypothetical protein